MSKNKQPVNVGVVGVGSLGQWHARIYSELEETNLVGVYDADAARAKEIADRYGCAAFPSQDALAADIEAASVVVPTDLHREVAGRLLEQNVHLLIEKPMAATTAEAEELVALSEQHDLIVQVGHVERFNPAFAYLQQAARHPKFIEAHRLAPYPPPRPGALPRGTEVSVVLDLMIHDLELILHLVGEPVVQVDAVGVPVLSPSEDIANVRLRFEGGCVANVTASRISPEKMRKIRVFIEDAYVSLDYQEQAGVVHRREGAAIVREEVPIEKGEPLANELRSFAACVADHGEPVVSGRHAAEALKLAIRILRVLKDESA